MVTKTAFRFFRLLVIAFGLLFTPTNLPVQSTNNNTSCMPVPSGLISWWPGNGNTNDIYGQNPGTITGTVSFTSGMVGQAFQFDGSTSYVRIPANTSLAVENLTISAWIYPTNLNIILPLVEFSKDSGSLAGVHLWINIGQSLGNVPGSFYANIRDQQGGNHYRATNGGVIKANQWNMVTMSFNSQTGVLKLFVNGSLMAQQNLGAGLIPNTSTPIYIGYRPKGSLDYLAGRSFIGYIDEIQIFDRSLSAQEIIAIFQSGSAGLCRVDMKPIYLPFVSQSS